MVSTGVSVLSMGTLTVDVVVTTVVGVLTVVVVTSTIGLPVTPDGVVADSDVEEAYKSKRLEKLRPGVWIL